MFTDLTKLAIQLSKQDIQRNDYPSPEALWMHALNEVEDAFHIFRRIHLSTIKMATTFSPACSVSLECDEIQCEDLLLGNIALGFHRHGAITFPFQLFFTLDILYVNWGPSDIKYVPENMNEFEEHLVAQANKFFPLLN